MLELEEQECEQGSRRAKTASLLLLGSVGLVFAGALLASQSIKSSVPGQRFEAEEGTYHVAFAFKESLDCGVQLLDRNRHAAAEIGDLAGGSRKERHDTKVRGYEDERESEREIGRDANVT